MISLTAEPGSFPFQEKHIVLTGATKITLGLEDLASSAIPRDRVGESSNGWFGAKHSADTEVVPLPLSELHAEIWLQGNQVFIRDLDSAFGTFVNDVRIQQSTSLLDGDIISLGRHVPRNSATPSYITDDHLKPIIAKIHFALSS